MALGDIYQKASLVQIPSGYKAADAELYSVVPNTTAGDFTVSVDADATRVNKDGLVESVAANQARLDYNPTNPQDPTLLLEPQRTNYATNNSSMDTYGTVGGSSPSPTLTADYTTAPDGSNTATRLQATVTGSNYSLIQFPSTPNGNGTYYISVYAKSNTGSNQTISFFGNSSSTNAHTVTTEWTRIIVEATRGSGLTKYAYLGTWASQHGSDASIDISVWGAQIEVDSNYATSLIPTSGSAVTRTVDFISNSYTGLTSASGTIFIDFDTKGFDFSFSKIIALRDTVTGDSLRLEPFDNSGTKKFAFFGINGSSATPPSEDILPINNRKKIALTFENGNFKYASDGVITTGTYSGTARQYNQIGGANITGGAMHNGIIHQFMVFNEALTDAELQTLTS